MILFGICFGNIVICIGCGRGARLWPGGGLRLSRTRGFSFQESGMFSLTGEGGCAPLGRGRFSFSGNEGYAPSGGDGVLSFSGNGMHPPLLFLHARRKRRAPCSVEKKKRTFEADLRVAVLLPLLRRWLERCLA